MAEVIALLSAYSSDVEDDSPATTVADGIAVLITDEGLLRDDDKVVQEEIGENVEGTPISSVEREEEEVLLDFLPPPPSTPCSEALEAKFAKYKKFKDSPVQISFNEDLRQRKGYRNPEFLQLAVLQQNIYEIGSCFDLEVFNPNGYDSSDYADVLMAWDMPHLQCLICELKHIGNQHSDHRKEADHRKELERRQNQRTSVDDDFVRATHFVTSQRDDPKPSTRELEPDVKVVDIRMFYEHTLYSLWPPSETGVLLLMTTTSESHSNTESVCNNAGYH